MSEAKRVIRKHVESMAIRFDINDDRKHSYCHTLSKACANHVSTTSFLIPEIEIRS